jgi:hypothetical protein
LNQVLKTLTPAGATGYGHPGILEKASILERETNSMMY